MPGENAFYVEGIVTETLPNGTYRVELANGHRVLAFQAGKAKRNPGCPAPGVKVRLQMSPYDLSEGRIITETKTI